MTRNRRWTRRTVLGLGTIALAGCLDDTNSNDSSDDDSDVEYEEEVSTDDPIGDTNDCNTYEESIDILVEDLYLSPDESVEERVSAQSSDTLVLMTRSEDGENAPRLEVVDSDGETVFSETNLVVNDELSIDDNEQYTVRLSNPSPVDAQYDASIRLEGERPVPDC